MISRQRLPEHRFARLRLVGGAAARADPSRELCVVGEAPDRVRQRFRIAGRDEQRALLVHEQLTRGGRVAGDERRAARERLESLVRNHALRLRAGAEDPERAAGGVELVGQELVLDPRDVLDVRRQVGEQALELSAADDAQGDVRVELRGGQDRLHALERNQLPDEQRLEVPRRCPPGTEDSLLRADEADLDVARGRRARRRTARALACPRRRGRRSGTRVCRSR